MDPIFGTMLGDPAIMASLFSLLGRLKPLDCMLAGYFSRVLTGLLLRRAREVLRYLQARSRVPSVIGKNTLQSLPCYRGLSKNEASLQRSDRRFSFSRKLVFAIAGKRSQKGQQLFGRFPRCKTYRTNSSDVDHRGLGKCVFNQRVCGR